MKITNLSIDYIQLAEGYPQIQSKLSMIKATEILPEDEYTLAYLAPLSI